MLCLAADDPAEEVIGRVIQYMQAELLSDGSAVEEPSATPLLSSTLIQQEIPTASSLVQQEVPAASPLIQEEISTASTNSRRRRRYATHGSHAFTPRFGTGWLLAYYEKEILTNLDFKVEFLCNTIR